MEDLRQAEEYRKYMESLGWVVEKGTFVKKLGLLPFCFVKYQRPSWPMDFKKLEKVIKKYRVRWVKIEPNVEIDKEGVEEKMLEHGFKKDRSPMLPTKTIWIDLKKSKDQLLKEMHFKTRYNIRKHKNIKAEILRGDEVSDKQIEEFFKIYKKNYQRQGFWGLKKKEIKSLLKMFGKKSYLLRVKDWGGLIVLIHDKVIYYSHNGATDQGRKKFVPTKLVWEAIKLGQKLKCERFDFEGINDERYKLTKKWQGFSRFKRGFGGEMIEYIGSFSGFKKG